MKHGCLQRWLALFLLCGGVWSFLGAYDAHAQGPTVRYTYDDLGRLKQVIDAQGNVRTYNYDAVGNILSIDAGAGGCPLAPPVITGIQPDSCQAGTTCQIIIDGSSLEGASVASNNPQAALSDCQTDCTQLTCRLTPSPVMTLGPINIVVTTAEGSAQAPINIVAPPILGGPGQTALWHFAANKDEIITLTMTRLPNQPNGSSTLDPQLELQDSRGVLLVRDDDSGSSAPPGPGKNAAIRNYTLPATDTYLVVARGASGTAGPYLLEISPSTRILVSGPPTPPPPPPTLQFTFAGDIATATERDTHTFPANGGTRVNIEVNRLVNQDGSVTLDPAMELRDSRNILLRSDNDGGTNQPPGPGRNAVLNNVLLQATDTYQIVVFGNGGAKGKYEVKVYFHQ